MQVSDDIGRVPRKQNAGLLFRFTCILSVLQYNVHACTQCAHSIRALLIPLLRYLYLLCIFVFSVCLIRYAPVEVILPTRKYVELQVACTDDDDEPYKVSEKN